MLPLLLPKVLPVSVCHGAQVIDHKGANWDQDPEGSLHVPTDAILALLHRSYHVLLELAVALHLRANLLDRCGVCAPFVSVPDENRIDANRVAHESVEEIHSILRRVLIHHDQKGSEPDQIEHQEDRSEVKWLFEQGQAQPKADTIDSWLNWHAAKAPFNLLHLY